MLPRENKTPLDGVGRNPPPQSNQTESASDRRWKIQTALGFNQTSLTFFRWGVLVFLSYSVSLSLSLSHSVSLSLSRCVCVSIRFFLCVVFYNLLLNLFVSPACFLYNSSTSVTSSGLPVQMGHRSCSAVG